MKDDQALDACRAALRYDDAIRACANDPDKMSSHCTAEGKGLDDLYADWISRAHAALAAPPAESTKPESLASLRGMAKGARGGSTSEELVERARGDWDSERAASAKELMEAAQCASNILFLLTAEVKALGLRADKVKEKLDAAIQAAKAEGKTP